MIISSALMVSSLAMACPDFSGKWAGKCDASGQSVPSSMEVKQTGCDRIEVGGEAIRIGEVNESTKEHAGSTIKTVMHPKWSGSDLVTTGTGEARETSSGKLQLESTFTSRMRFDGPKLVTEIENNYTSYSTEPPTRGQFQATCTLDKQY